MNNFSIYQIFLGIISVFFFFNGIFKFIKKEQGQSFFKLFITLLVWGFIFFFTLFPQLAHIISEQLGMGENLNTLIFTGFIIVFIIIYKMLNLIERLERNISEIVRKNALSKLKK